MTSATATIAPSSIQTQQLPQTPSLTLTEMVKVVGEFFNTAFGMHRLYQICTTAFKWTVELNPAIAGADLEAINDRITTADNVSNLPKLFNTTKCLVSNWEAYQFERARPNADQNTLSSRCRQVAVDAIEWVGDFANTLLIGLPDHYGVQFTSVACDLVLDVSDFGEGLGGVRRSNADLVRLQNSSADERRRPTEEGRLHWLLIAKAVCSFVGNAAGLAGLITGTAILPSVTLLVASTAMLTFALWKQFYGDTMTHVLEERLRSRQVELLAAA